MKLVISGVAYSLDDAITKATLGDLYTLKVKNGLSMKTILVAFKKVSSAMEPLDLLDDADVLNNLVAMIWLARRKGGEFLTFEEAGAVAFDDITFETDDDDEVEDEQAAEADVPKELSAAVPNDSSSPSS